MESAKGIRYPLRDKSCYLPSARKAVQTPTVAYRPLRWHTHTRTHTHAQTHTYTHTHTHTHMEQTHAGAVREHTRARTCLNNTHIYTHCKVRKKKENEAKKRKAQPAVQVSLVSSLGTPRRRLTCPRRTHTHKHTHACKTLLPRLDESRTHTHTANERQIDRQTERESERGRERERQEGGSTHA